MQKTQMEEAARAFYNSHETDVDFRTRLWCTYVFLFVFSGLIMWGGVALIQHILTPDPEEDYSQPGFGVLFIIFMTFSLPMILTLAGQWGVKVHKVYLKIIRKKYDPKFKILGFFWF